MRLGICTVALGLLLFSAARSPIAHAQSKAPAKATSVEKPAKQRAKPRAKATPRAPVSSSKKAKAQPEAPSEGTPSGTSAVGPPRGSGESLLEPGASSAAEAGAGAQAGVREKEGPEGVKTYQFGAIEVEGRLKSPQLIYFLRRVRAEFEARALGHRSFLGELSDTRNAAALR